MSRKKRKPVTAFRIVDIIDDQLILRFNRAPIPGKLLDVIVPDKVQAERVYKWSENYEQYKRTINMLGDKIKQSKTEEEQQEYKKELSKQLNKFTQRPLITKGTKIRARVKTTTLEGTILEPAFDVDCRRVINAGFTLKKA